MVYKRYVKKNGKTFGPYYYDSYREGEKVKKTYIGGEKEYKIWKKKNNKSVEQPKTGGLFRFLFVGFLLLLILSMAALSVNYYYGNNQDSGNIFQGKGFMGTGFAVEEIESEDSTESSDEKDGLEDQEVVPDESESQVEEATPEQEIPEDSSGSSSDSAADEPLVEETKETSTDEKITSETLSEESTNKTQEVPTDETEESTNETEESTNKTQEVPTDETEESTNETEVPTNTTKNITNETMLEEAPNITLPDEEINITSDINISLNETLIENITEVINKTQNISIKTLQYSAVIGRPVKWITVLNKSSEDENQTVLGIPKEAENITILTGNEIEEAIDNIDEYEEVVETTDREDMVSGGLLTGNVAYDIKDSYNFLEKTWNWIVSFRITGNVIEEVDLEDANITVEKTENSTVINLTEIIELEEIVAVEYYTEAPKTIEAENARGKVVVISSPEELNYTDILAYTLIDESYNVTNQSQIQIIWHENTDLINAGANGSIAQNQTSESTETNESKQINLLSITGESIITTENDTVNEPTEEPAEETIEVVINETINQTTISEENQTINQTIPESTTNVTADNQTSPAENVSIETPTETPTETPVEEPTITNETIPEEPVVTQEATPTTKILNSSEYIAHDLDNNGVIDYVEWVVPHLSNQSYEIIIKIIKAEHLDENRTFISDIYDDVKEQDNNWSETINESEYVRVTFEQELDNNKDITIYARQEGYICNETIQEINGTNVSVEICPENNISVNIEVYEENGNETIALFENVTKENWYKIYLDGSSGTGLNGTQDVFDLRIINGDVEFDYIVDPIEYILFMPPTPDDLKSISNLFVEINASINSSDLIEIKYNWNGTNYTFYENDLVTMYNFDNLSILGENDTHVYDVSPSQNNGTAVNAALNSSDCKFDKCYRFDGDGDYIDFGTDIAPFSTQLTFSMWINFQSSAKQALLSKNDDSGNENAFLMIWINTISGFRIYSEQTSGDFATNAGVPELGVWHHYTVSLDTSSNVAKLYLDGVLNSTITGTDFPDFDFATSGYPWSIGQERDSGTRGDWLDANIDEFKLWNKTFSDAEVSQMYLMQLSKTSTSNWILYVNQSKNATDPLDIGTYNYQVFGLGADSSVASSDKRFVTVDTTLPILTINSPTNGSYYSNSSILFNVSSTEEGTGFIIPNLDNSLIAWWRMDDVDGSGEPQDYMGNDHGVKQDNAIQVSNGKFGKGFELDDNGDYIRLDDDLYDFPAGTDFSVSAWFNTNNITDTNNGLVCDGAASDSIAGWAIIQSTDDLSVHISNGSGASGVSRVSAYVNNVIAPDTWYHVLATYNRTGNMTFYLDGNQVHTKVISHIPGDLTNTRIVGIGRWINSETQVLNGTIDEVMIWNKSLTAGEALSLYNATNLFHAETVAEGNHNYTAYASDLAGNIESSSVNFSVDNTFPSLSIASPFNISYANSTILFNVSSDVGSSMIVPNLNNNLVGWWRMDDINGTGAPTDYMGVNNGTNVDNAVQTDSGMFGKGFNLDGDGDYIEIGEGTNLEGMDELSVAFWFYENEWVAGNGTSYLSRGTDYYGAYSVRKYAGAGTSIRWAVRNSSGDYSDNALAGVLVEDKWQFFTGTYNGTHLVAYLDGVAGTPVAAIGAVSTAESNLRIGGNPTVAGNYKRFNGTIDEVMIWNKSLTTDEALALYNATRLEHVETLTEGVYNYTAYSSDFSGNINTSSIAFEVDQTIPSLIMDSPSNASYANSTILFNVSSDEGSAMIVPNFNNSLLAWFRMDDINSTGHPSDYLGVNNGTAQGNATQIDNGKFGKGFVFDSILGTAVRTSTVGIFNTSKAFTVSAWFYRVGAGAGGASGVFAQDDYSGNYDGFHISADSTVRCVGYIGSGSTAVYTDSGSINNNEWYHATCVYNGTEMKVYLNGEKEDENDVDISNTDVNTRPIAIGKLYSTPGHTNYVFNGTIDEVMVWNRTLTADEVLSLYNATRLEHVETLYEGSHNYKIYSSDLAGNINTLNINLEIDQTNPSLTIISPTNTSNSNNSILFNVSSDAGSAMIVPSLDTSLVAWFRMDDIDGSGDPSDYFGINDGTAIADATQTDSGKFGKGFTFDGTDDYISITDSSSLDITGEEITLAMWVYPITGENHTQLLRKYASGGGYLMNYPNTGIPNVAIYNGSTYQIQSMGGPLPLNEWSFLVGTYDSTDSMIMYYNGILNESSPATRGEIATSSGGALYLGYQGWQGSDNQKLNGSLDEVMIFNRSLSAEEILSLYNATRLEYAETIADGGHNYTIYASDFAGNLNISYVNFTIDSTSPAIEFASSTTSDASAQNNTDIFVNITSSDTNHHYSFADFDNDVVLWMRMDDTNSTGDPTDLSSYQNNGTASSGAIQIDNGMFGKGFEFDDATGYVDLGSPENLNLTDVFTVSLWAKKKDINEADIFIGDDYRNWEIYVSATQFSGYYGTNTTPFWSGAGGINHDVDPLEWNHYVYVYNFTQQNISLYSNGTYKGSVYSVLMEQYIQNNKLQIGRRSTSGGSRYYNGSLDDVIIFNRSLSSAEIAALYNATATRYSNNFTELEENVHNFTGYAVDSFGNKNQTEERSVTVDLTKPSVDNIISINESETTDGTVTRDDTVTINATISDNIEVSKVWAKVWEGLVGTSTVLWEGFLSLVGAVWTVTFSTNASFLLGEVNYTIYANDTTGNEINQSDSFIVVENSDVTYCRNLDQENTIYTLQNDIAGIVGTCFNITASNVTLNLNGKNITGDDSGSDYGVYTNSYNNLTIINGSIHGFAWGVYLDSSSENSLLDLNTSNNVAAGIYLLTSSNNIITNITANSNDIGIYLAASSDNNIITNVTSNLNTYAWYLLATGVYFSSSSNNTLNEAIFQGNSYGVYLSTNADNNNLSNILSDGDGVSIIIWDASNNTGSNITSNNPVTTGIYLTTNSDNNKMSNFSFWNCSQGVVGACIYVSNSGSNTFDGGYINYTAEAEDNGIYVYSSGASSDTNNNLFKNINISNIAGDSIFMSHGGGSNLMFNNTFLNVSYESENVYEKTELIRKWYYQAYVNDTDNNDIATATVAAYNTSDGNEFSTTTNSSGWTDKTEITEYVNVAGTITQYSNYSINATKTGYGDNAHTFNVTVSQNNLNDVFTLNTSLNITQIISINESGTTGGTVTRGDNITINATIDNATTVDKVWVKVWEGVIGTSTILYQGFLDLIAGVWTITFGTNYSFPVGEVNYTIYANDTLGQEENMNGTFTTLQGLNLTECGTLNTADSTYILRNDITEITGNCFTVTANSVTIDLNGYNITGDADDVDDYGITVSSYNDTTIKNGEIYDFGRGISSEDGNNGNYTNLTIGGIITSPGVFCMGSGIYLSGDYNNIQNVNASNVNLTGCTFSAAHGILLTSSSNNNLSDIVSNNDEAGGVYIMSSSNNNTLYNITSSNNSYGVYIYSSSNNNVSNITSNNNDNEGIGLSSSSNNNTISNITSNDNVYGIHIQSGSGNNIIANSSYINNSYGFSLSTSGDNILRRNNMSNNTYNFHIYGSSNSHFTNDIDPSNIVDNTYKIYYNYSISNYIHDLTSAPSAGAILCANCTNVTIKDVNLSHFNYNGAYLFNSTNSTLTNLTSNNNYAEIALPYSSNNTITNIVSSGRLSFSMSSSVNNTFTNLTFNNGNGIYMGSGCSDNTFLNITSNNNSRYLAYLYLSHNNTFSNISSQNCSTSSSYGCIHSYNSNSNFFENVYINYTADSAKGVYIRSSAATDSRDNFFKDIIIENTNGASVYIERTNGLAINNTFLNATYDDESFSGTSTELIRQWYLDVNVTNSTGAFSGAVVNATNSSETQVFSKTTSASGFITTQAIAEYTNFEGTRTDASNYSLNTTATSYLQDNRRFNFTTNTQIDVPLVFGSVTSCGTLDKEGTTYVLQNNVSSTDTCFNVTAENITINCNGYEINYSHNGTLGYGVYSNQDRTNVTNCIIVEGNATTRYKHVIYYDGVSNGAAWDNNITALGVYADSVRLVDSPSNNVSRNKIRCGSNAAGIYALTNSHNATISSNNITCTGNYAKGIQVSNTDNHIIENNIVSTTNSYASGIVISNSRNNTINSNNMTVDYSLGIYLASNNFGDCNQTMSSNFVNGLPLNYSEGDNLVFDSLSNEYGQLIVSSSSNVTVSNSNFTTSGLTFCSVSNSRVDNNNFSANGYGTFLSDSEENNITNNYYQMGSTYADSVYLLWYSSNNYIAHNVMDGVYASSVGIIIGSLNSNNYIYNNSISGINSHGINLNYNAYNTVIKGTNITITGATTNRYGIYISSNKVNATMIDSSINTTGSYDIYAHSGLTAGSQLVLINTSYNKSDVYVGGDYFTLYNQYYLDVNLTDSSDDSAVNDALVNASYGNGSLIFSELTNASGFITPQNITEFKQNITGKYYFSNYTLNTTATAYAQDDRGFNMSDNLQVDISLTFTDLTTCGTLGQENKTYTLQNNLTIDGTCFNITANNVTLDLNGFNITGSSAVWGKDGIHNKGYNSTTIKNGSIEGFGVGIYIHSSFNNTFLDIISSSNTYAGISVIESDNNILTNISGSSNDVGVYITNSDNNILTNISGNSNSYKGYLYAAVVFMSSSSNNTLSNVVSNDNQGSGVYLYSNSDIVVSNLSSNGDNTGISLYSNANINLTNLTFQSNIGTGIDLYSNNGSVISNFSLWNFSSGGVGASIRAKESDNNIFENGLINYTSEAEDYGIWVQAEGTVGTDVSDNNIFRNINITNIAGTSVFIDDGGGSSAVSNNTFINVSYDSETVDTNSELIRKWYYQAYVNDTDNNDISSVTVAAYNTSDGSEFSIQTNSSGWINKTEITEYVNVAGTITQYSNYSINATKTGYGDDSHTFNVTLSQNNLNDVFTFNTSFNITQIITINESGTVGGTVTRGDNITINATINNATTVDKVWVKVWEGVIGASTVIYQGFLDLIAGVWTITFGTNYSFPIGEVNYTIYANDTLGQEENMNGTFTTLQGLNLTECGTLNTANSVYTLKSNVNSTSTCFNITAENVTLDCDSYEINYSYNGTLGYAVYSNQDGTNVTNCVVKEGTSTTHYKDAIFYDGVSSGVVLNNNITTLAAYSDNVRLDGSVQNIVQGNILITSGGRPVSVDGTSDYTTISSNNITTTNSYGYGIEIGGSDHSLITNNNITTTNVYAVGMMIDRGTNNTFTGNNMTTAYAHGMHFYASSASNCNNTLSANNVNGLPIYYVEDSDDSVIDSLSGEYGQVIVSLSDNVTVSNSNFSNASLTFCGVTNSRIDNNNFSSKGYGSYLVYSTDNNITNNYYQMISGYSPSVYAVYFAHSNYIAHNVFDNLYQYSQAITINGISYTDIYNNSISGVNSNGIYLYNSEDTTIRDTNITITGTLEYALRISSSKVNATVTDSSISHAGNYDIYASDSLTAGSKLELINTTFNKSDVSINDDDFRLYNKYYLDINVSDSSNESAISGALVNASYSNGTLMFSLSTNASGLTLRQNVTEYIQNWTGEENKTYLTNYSLNTTKTGYSPDNRAFNLTTNAQIDVPLVFGILADCQVLSVANTSYTLQENASSTGTCFDITANNVTIDCNGYGISGDDSSGTIGVNVVGYNSSTIKNCIITHFETGIYAESAIEMNISGNTIEDGGTACDAGRAIDFNGVNISSIGNNYLNNISGDSMIWSCGFDYASELYLYNSHNNNFYSNNIDGMFAYDSVGWTWESGSYYGVYLTSSSNNVFTDITIKNNSGNGFSISSSSNNTLSNVTSNDNLQTAVYLSSSYNNTLSNITASDSSSGVYLTSSSGNNLSNITASENTNGIYLTSSSNNTLRDNNMTNNTDNFRFTGTTSDHHNNDIDTSNTVDYSYSIIYNYSISDYVFDLTTVPNAGIVICAVCDNVTVKDLNLSHSNSHGALLFETTNSSLTNITASSNDYGVYLTSSSNNTLSNIVSSDNSQHGVYLTSSSNNTLSNITSNDNSYGVYLTSSSDNNLSNITSNDNSYGIYLTSSSSDNNLTTLVSNSNLYYGLYLSASLTNVFSDITSNSNPRGIRLSSSGYNKITGLDTWNCSGSSSYGCIYSSTSHNCIFEDVYINYTTSSGEGARTYNSKNNLFKDIIIENVDGNDVHIDWWYSGTNAMNNTFLNATYSDQSLYAHSELFRKWYYSVYVNDSNGDAMTSIDVIGYDNNEDQRFAAVTNASGWVDKAYITEYRNFEGTKTYYNNYSIHATNGTYDGYHNNYNVSIEFNNINDNIEIGVADPYIVIGTPENITDNNASIIFNVSTNSFYEGNSMIVPNLDNNLVAWFRMDDVNASGDPTDYLGVYNGTAVGNAAQTNDGQFGKGFDLDGDGDYINAGNDERFNFVGQNFSISFWGKAAEVGSNQRVIRKGAYNVAGYEIFMDENGATFRTYQSGVYQATSSNAFSGPDVWHHITVVRNGANANIFVDGVNETGATESHINPDSASAYDFLIGYYGSSTYDFNGTIDEVLVWNKTLTSDEVLALYNATSIYHAENLSEKVHSYITYISDSFGNVNSDNVTFEIDLVSPTLTIHNPLNDSSNDLSVLFNVSSDAGGAMILPSLDHALVGWWRMDDLTSGGYPADYLGANNITSFTGTPTQIDDGKFGKAFDFDNGEHADVSTPGTSLDIAGNEITVSLWVNTELSAATSGNEPIVIKAQSTVSPSYSWQFDSRSDGGFSDTYRFTVGYSGSGYRIYANDKYNEDQWYHLVGVYNGSHSYMYVDGIKQDDIEAIGGITPTDVEIRFGGDSAGYSHVGKLDEIAIWNKTLSDEEVLSLYNATRLSFTDTLSEGNYTYDVYAGDFAGNVNTSSIEFESSDLTIVTSCVELFLPDTVYTLYNNVSSTGTCFNVTANNVTIDCNGYKINYSTNGTLGYGVYSYQNYTNVTSCIITEGNSTTNSKHGVYYNGVSSGVVTKNNITPMGTYSYGVNLVSSPDNTISQNTMIYGANKVGIYIQSSSHNASVISNNITSTSSYAQGIILTQTDNHIIENNTISTSSSATAGILLSNSRNNTVNFNNITVVSSLGIELRTTNKDDCNQTMSSNYVNDFLLNYSEEDNVVFDSLPNGYGQIIVSLSDNVTVSNSNFTNDGLTFCGVTNSRVENNNFSSYGAGNLLSSSTDNNITGNYYQISSASSASLTLMWGSNDNYVAHNTFNNTNNYVTGINLFGSTGCDIYNNSISGVNSDGIYSQWGATDNTIRNTNITITGTSGEGIEMAIGTVDAIIINSSINSVSDWDIYSGSVNAGSQLELINVTFNKTSVSMTNDNFKLYNKYYLDVNVTDSNDNSAIIAALVNSSYNNGSLVFSELSAASGFITQQNVTEYFENSTGKYYLSNYSLNTTKSGYSSDNQIFNFTTNTQIDVELVDVLSPIMFVTGFSALDNESISVQFNVTDENSIDTWWINDSNFEIAKDVGENATLTNATILSTDLYSINVSVNDTVGNINSTTIMANISQSNVAPVVTLSYPVDIEISNRTPTFNWTCYDENGDDCTYEIEINEVQDSGAFSCTDDTSDTASTEEYPVFLKCFKDLGYSYNWSVRAHDGKEWGDWTIGVFNLTATTEAILLDSDLDFGELDPFGTPNDTTNDNPQPFVIQNDGNAVINISYNATPIWDQESSPTNNYRIKVDNKTDEEGAFTWLTSIFDWVNVSFTGAVILIDKLNYSDAKDTAEIDIYLRTPQNEPPGPKGSTITLETSLAEEES
jgi:parallel beta-helix repeat protein